MAAEDFLQLCSLVPFFSQLWRWRMDNYMNLLEVYRHSFTRAKALCRPCRHGATQVGDFALTNHSKPFAKTS